MRKAIAMAMLLVGLPIAALAQKDKEATAPGGAADAPSSYTHGDDPDWNPAIPKTHMPPPGKCRIWYPNRPVSEQPPPGLCVELREQLPQGAVLVRSIEHGS